MFFQKHSTIRSELTRLVVGCVLPVWLVSAYLVYYAYSSKLEQLKRIMLEDVQSTILNLDRDLTSAQAALQALATSHSFQEGDLREVHRQSLALLRAYSGTDIIVTDRSGQQIVNSYLPFGAPLPRLSHPQAPSKVFTSGRPVIGDLFYGVSSRRPLIFIEVPVIRNGKVIYDLAMVLSSYRLSALLHHQTLPEGWYSTIVDNNEVVISRSSDQGYFVGKKASAGLRRAMADSSFGVSESKNLRDVPVLVAFCKSSLSGWTVVVGVPKARLTAQIYQWMAWGVGGATIISLIGMFSAMAIARRIAHSIQSLVPPAKAIGHGEPVTTIPFQPIKETKDVSQALMEASKLIQHNIETVREHQEGLRQVNELLEQRVLERTADLEAAVREQEAFSYSVSHDLRAPLRHMNSYCAILAEEYLGNLPEQACHYLDRIGHASKKMGELIDNLLELSRITRVRINPERVDLSELAASTLRMLQETEPKREVEILVEPGLIAWGDHSLLRQLLLNLLGNGWKYSSQKERARLEFGRAAVAGGWAYHVSDNGTGFDMTFRHKLFQPFERLHGNEFDGIGIGLATAQRVVQRHGGTIWAEARIGEGATFYFTLPQPCQLSFEQ